MDKAQRLNNEIGFVRDFIRQLETDPQLNGEILEQLHRMLKGFESQVIAWELTGYDSGGNRNSFLAHQICSN